jgi:hypothetical protein
VDISFLWPSSSFFCLWVGGDQVLREQCKLDSSIRGANGKGFMSALFRRIDALLDVPPEQRRPVPMRWLALVFIVLLVALAVVSIYLAFMEKDSMAGIKAAVSCCFLTLLSIGIVSGTCCCGSPSDRDRDRDWVARPIRAAA